MGEFPRKADGRRVFSAEFKRETVQRFLSGEKTLAELSRDLDISPTVIRHWKRRFETAAATAVPGGLGRGAGECASGGPVADPGARACAGAQDDGERDSAGGGGGCKKKSVVAQRIRALTGFPVAAICRGPWAWPARRPTTFPGRVLRDSIAVPTTRPFCARFGP